MAKKKTSEGRAPTAEHSEAAAPARRRTAKPRARAAAERSPVDAGMATSTEEVQAIAHDTGVSTYEPTYAEIAEAAYMRFLQRGGTHGRDFDDWVAAERELRERRMR